MHNGFTKLTIFKILFFKNCVPRFAKTKNLTKGDRDFRANYEQRNFHQEKTF